MRSEYASHSSLSWFVRQATVFNQDVLSFPSLFSRQQLQGLLAHPCWPSLIALALGLEDSIEHLSAQPAHAGLVCTPHSQDYRICAPDVCKLWCCRTGVSPKAYYVMTAQALVDWSVPDCVILHVIGNSSSNECIRFATIGI